MGRHDCRKVVCIHLQQFGQKKGEAAAGLTGAPATAEAALAQDYLKVMLATLIPFSSSLSCCFLLCSNSHASSLHAGSNREIQGTLTVS